MEKIEEQYEAELKIIDEIFKDANFSVSIDIDELDELLTDKKQIIIKSDYKCYCYANEVRQPEYFQICGDCITNKYVLEELMKQNLNLNCNHYFIEGFLKSVHSDIQYEIITGS
jgi:hypothetical protein